MRPQRRCCPRRLTPCCSTRRPPTLLARSASAQPVSVLGASCDHAMRIMQLSDLSQPEFGHLQARAVCLLLLAGHAAVSATCHLVSRFVGCSQCLPTWLRGTESSLRAQRRAALAGRTSQRRSCWQPSCCWRRRLRCETHARKHTPPRAHVSMPICIPSCSLKLLLPRDLVCFAPVTLSGC